MRWGRRRTNRVGADDDDHKLNKRQPTTKKMRLGQRQKKLGVTDDEQTALGPTTMITNFNEMPEFNKIQLPTKCLNATKHGSYITILPYS
jgi:hypothetical protein